jgi:hypothetical protein
MLRAELIARRRAFRLPGYCTLADVGLDGEYVSPPQITSCSETGPVLLAYNWLDAQTARKHAGALRECGYLKGMIFNNIVDAVLARSGITRAHIYITQAFHLLPEGRSDQIPQKDMDASFDAITRHELVGRKIVALGVAAAGCCSRAGITPNKVVPHPSARIGMSAKIEALILAIKAKPIAEQSKNRETLPT